MAASNGGSEQATPLNAASSASEVRGGQASTPSSPDSERWQQNQSFYNKSVHGYGLARPIYLPRELTGLGQVSEMDGFDMIAQHHPQLHHQQLHLQQVHKIQMHHGTRSQMHGATIRVHGSTGKVGTPMTTMRGSTSLEMVMSLSGMERKSIELSILGKSISGQRLQE